MFEYFLGNFDCNFLTNNVEAAVALPTGVLVSTGALNHIQRLLSRVHFPNL